MAISQERRNINASESSCRTKAIKQLTTTNFQKKYMGSGFNIQITDLQGVALCPEFVVNGEDMEQIAPVIVESLKQSLVLTRVLLQSQLKDIDEALS